MSTAASTRPARNKADQAPARGAEENGPAWLQASLLIGGFRAPGAVRCAVLGRIRTRPGHFEVLRRSPAPLRGRMREGRHARDARPSRPRRSRRRRSFEPPPSPTSRTSGYHSASDPAPALLRGRTLEIAALIVSIFALAVSVALFSIRTEPMFELNAPSLVCLTAARKLSRTREENSSGSIAFLCRTLAWLPLDTWCFTSMTRRASEWDSREPDVHSSRPGRGVHRAGLRSQEALRVSPRRHV